MVGIVVSALLLVLVGGFAALCWIGSGAKDWNGPAGKYDERQKLSQGRGAIWGFAAVCIFGFALIIACAIVGRELLPASEAMVIAIFLGGATIANYCVAHDAYIPIGGSGIAEMICMGLYTLASLIRGFERLEEQGLVAGGALGKCWVWFSMAFACASVFLSLLAKKLLDRRRGE